MSRAAAHVWRDVDANANDGGRGAHDDEEQENDEERPKGSDIGNGQWESPTLAKRPGASVTI